MVRVSGGAVPLRDSQVCPLFPQLCASSALSNIRRKPRRPALLGEWAVHKDEYGGQGCDHGDAAYSPLRYGSCCSCGSTELQSCDGIAAFLCIHDIRASHARVGITAMRHAFHKFKVQVTVRLPHVHLAHSQLVVMNVHSDNRNELQVSIAQVVVTI